VEERAVLVACSVLAGCKFETARLSAKEWKTIQLSEETSRNLPDFVAELMTSGVTKWLPPGWQGSYSRARASDWIEETYDSGGALLLVVDSRTDATVGLMILGEDGVPGKLEIRIGYLLLEKYWGLGLATEIVGGFAHWCAARPEIVSVLAGADSNNLASRRVLEKAGFQLFSDAEAPAEDVVYRLQTG